MGTAHPNAGFASNPKIDGAECTEVVMVPKSVWQGQSAQPEGASRANGAMIPDAASLTKFASDGPDRLAKRRRLQALSTSSGPSLGFSLPERRTAGGAGLAMGVFTFATALTPPHACVCPRIQE